MRRDHFDSGASEHQTWTDPVEAQGVTLDPRTRSMSIGEHRFPVHSATRWASTPEMKEITANVPLENGHIASVHMSEHWHGRNPDHAVVALHKEAEDGMGGEHTLRNGNEAWASVPVHEVPGVLQAWAKEPSPDRDTLDVNRRKMAAGRWHSFMPGGN